PATTQADEMHAAGLYEAGSRFETVVMDGCAIRVRSRRGIGLVQRQPLVRLLDAVVMKFVVYLTLAQGFDEVSLDVFGELTRMDSQVGEGKHARDGLSAINHRCTQINRDFIEADQEREDRIMLGGLNLANECGQANVGRRMGHSDFGSR